MKPRIKENCPGCYSAKDDNLSDGIKRVANSPNGLFTTRTMRYYSMRSTTKMTGQPTQRLIDQKDVELSWRPLKHKNDKATRHPLSLKDDEPPCQHLHHA